MTHIDTLIRAIRRGRVASGQDAANCLGLSLPHTWRILRAARRAGHRIATRTGGRWLVLNKGEK